MRTWRPPFSAKRRLARQRGLPAVVWAVVLGEPYDVELHLGDCMGAVRAKLHEVAGVRCRNQDWDLLDRKTGVSIDSGTTLFDHLDGFAPDMVRKGDAIRAHLGTMTDPKFLLAPRIGWNG